jgi:hypothetical protein
MTQLDLDAIEARANAATPGPWDGDTCDGISQHWTREKPWLDVLVMEGSDSWAGCNHRISVSEGDAEFIAHAREDVPALVQRVRELEADNQQLRQTVIDAGQTSAEHGPFGS